MDLETPRSSALAVRPDAVVADRFRLVRELGRGGMGEVWRAHHLSLDIPCAVKFIHDRRLHHPEAAARFSQEARAAAKLRSPHVVQIYDHGVWRGLPYIAMELLEGETLLDRIDREGPLPLEDTCEVVRQIALALTRAGELGIVHRDLKPENIFFSREGSDERVKVLDFGVAKLESGSTGRVKTRSDAFLGTPHYMSPEQAHGAKAVDHRSDLWSLGIIAFECATAELPFDDEGLGALIRLILSGPCPQPSAYARLPGAFDAWFARACHRDPAQRFQTAAEMSEALAEVLRAEVAEPTPSSPCVVVDALPSDPRRPTVAAPNGPDRAATAERALPTSSRATVGSLGGQTLSPGEPSPARRFAAALALVAASGLTAWFGTSLANERILEPASPVMAAAIARAALPDEPSSARAAAIVAAPARVEPDSSVEGVPAPVERHAPPPRKAPMAQAPPVTRMEPGF